MRTARTRTPLAAMMLLAVPLTACATGARAVEEDGPTPRQASRAIWVVRGADMRPAHTVLEGLRSRYPSMQLRNNGRCMDLVIRGRGSMQGSSSPRVYVDGQRAADSCILSLMRAGEVRRIEVYPSGHTARAGYLSDPNGLVLVFTRDGSEDG